MRDALMGKTVQDIDVVEIGESAEEVIEHVKPFLRKKFLVNDRFSTVRCVLKTSQVVDFSCAEDIESDLLRRDFTINAMAYHLADDTWYDPFGGREDVARGKIRAVREENLIEDPIRILRGFRFIGELNFTPEEKTLEWFHQYRHLVRKTAGERISEEIKKIFSSRFFLLALHYLHLTQVLEAVFPALESFPATPASSFSPMNLWEHTLACLKELENILAHPENHFERFGEKVSRYLRETCPLWVIRLALLLHDVGKPVTMEKKENGWTFYGHDVAGAEIAENILKLYRFSGEEVEWVKTLISGHLRVGFLSDQYPVSARAIYRFYKDYGEKGIALLVLARADILGYHLLPEEHQWGKYQKETIRELLSAYYEKAGLVVKPRRLLSGSDLKQMGIPPGPIYSLILDRVAEAQVEGSISTKEEAIHFVRQYLKSLSGEDYVAERP